MTTIRLKTDSTLHIQPSTEPITRLHSSSSSNFPSPLSSSTRLGWTTTGPHLTAARTLTVNKRRVAPSSREPLTRGPKSTAPATRRKSASSGAGSRSSTVLQASGHAASVRSWWKIRNQHLKIPASLRSESFWSWMFRTSSLESVSTLFKNCSFW